MSMLGDIGTAFSMWIDTVAGTVKAAVEHFQTIRRIEVLEEDDGAFTIRLTKDAPAQNRTLIPQRVRIIEGAVSGLPPEWTEAFRDGRVSMVLRPSRFLCRPLDLPKRATEFLDGIIRSQIDRLTPWSANDAAYYWTQPSDAAADRVTLTIVATARSMLMPLVQAVTGLGASVVEVSTWIPGESAVPVTVYNHRTRAAAELGRIRVALRAVFAIVGLAALGSTLASGFLDDYYDGQQRQIQRGIAERRGILQAAQSRNGNSALDLLESRKQQSPSSVVVIEALSALLPDHTYATELRVEGDKLQIVGITHDAPSLIQVLERSPHFTRATFFAPTTRGLNDPGDRFHIEARIRPNFEISQ
jgi:general secretion pathway protein L